MDKIEINAELLFELANIKEWVRKVPRILPPKIRFEEKFIWVDANGHVFECGADFMAAEALCTYPCKVYRTKTVSEWAKEKEVKGEI